MRITQLAAALALALASTSSIAENLQQAYELARASDPQLKLAENAMLRSQQEIKLARSALLPQASASYSLSNSRTTTPLQSDTNAVIADADIDSDSSQFEASVNQTIYDHADYTRLQAARASAERFEASYRAAEQDLLIRVAQAYFNVLTSQETLASAKAEETAVARQLEQAEQRFNVGLTAITDVHEARARFDAATAAAILSENELDDAKAALTELSGKTIETVATVREQIPLTPPEPSDWSKWVSTALEQSPTLRARELGVKAQEANLRTAKAAHLPTISAFVSYSDSTNDRTTGIPGIGNVAGTSVRNETDSDSTVVGVRLQVPIFTGFANSTRVKQAVFDLESAKDEVEQERRAITRQTRNAYRQVLAGTSEVKAREQALVSARAALEATEAGFEVGTRTIVDVLLSQQLLFQAQRDRARASCFFAEPVAFETISRDDHPGRFGANQCVAGR